MLGQPRRMKGGCESRSTVLKAWSVEPLRCRTPLQGALEAKLIFHSINEMAYGFSTISLPKWKIEMARNNEALKMNEGCGHLGNEPVDGGSFSLFL